MASDLVSAMASSAATTYASGFSVNGVRPNCRCGIPSPLKVAMMEANARRRFYGCGNFQGGNGSGSCRFFKWSDPPVPDHLKALLFAMAKEKEEYKLMYHRCLAERDQLQRGEQHPNWRIRMMLVVVGAFILYLIYC